jgi:ATP-dependent Clp protease ATP-binding subunit ClpC
MAGGRELTSFGEYSGEAMRVLLAARQALHELGGLALTPDHMLHGILKVPASEACAYLRRAGVAVDGLKDGLLASAAETDPGDIDAPLSAEAAAVLVEASRAGSGHIRSTHVLLGILREGTSEAARLLRKLGVAEPSADPAR